MSGCFTICESYLHSVDKIGCLIFIYQTLALRHMFGWEYYLEAITVRIMLPCIHDLLILSLVNTLFFVKLFVV